MIKTQEQVNKEMNDRLDEMTRIIYSDEDMLFIAGALGERNDVYLKCGADGSINIVTGRPHNQGEIN